jgi:hypothetical protein
VQCRTRLQLPCLRLQQQDLFLSLCLPTGHRPHVLALSDRYQALAIGPENILSMAWRLFFYRCFQEYLYAPESSRGSKSEAKAPLTGKGMLFFQSPSYYHSLFSGGQASVKHVPGVYEFLFHVVYFDIPALILVSLADSSLFS